MCGLFGFIAQDKNQLDMETFLHLGCENDIRGGDSVGIFIDKTTEYGVDKLKLFNNFYPESELLAHSKMVHVAIGHTRKASVGVVGLQTAQPVVIKNAKTGEIDFVLMHNGTITNHAELKKKLANVPEHYTDSQIMAYVLYYNGTSMFKEYEGAGMFVIVDYRTNPKYPIVSFFKGGSKENTWSKVVEEERPFYILQTNNGIWFSSVEKPLKLKAHGTKYKVEKLPVNTVFSYQRASLINTETIDRSEMVQKKTYSTTTYPENNYYQNSIHNNSQFVNKNVYSSNKTPQIKYTDAFPVMSVCVNTDIVKVEFLKGFYLVKSKPFTGQLTLSDYGFIPPTIIKTIHFDYYFFLGVLVYGRNVLDALLKFQTDFQISDEDMLNNYGNIVYNYAHNLKYTNTKECFRIKDFDAALYNGIYFPLFNPTYPMEYTIKEGKITSYIEKNYNEASKEALCYMETCKELDKLTSDEYLTIFIENMK